MLTVSAWSAASLASTASTAATGTQPLAHSRAWRHEECRAHAPSGFAQCRAAQDGLGGKPGHFSLRQLVTAKKRGPSSVFTNGSGHFCSQSKALRQSDSVAHLATDEKQFFTTQTLLGAKVSGSMGQRF